MALAGRLNQTKQKRGPHPPLKVESRIGIMAPAEAVWEVLRVIEDWPHWNPLYPSAKGELRIGGRLSLTLALPGEPHRPIEPVVLDWVPNEQILWRDLAWGGWVKSVRYIEIDEVDKNACIISNGELFRGWIAEFYGNKHRRALKKGFTAMSEQIKRHAETLWQDQQR